MIRRPDWMARLDALVGAHARTPFAWGQQDCCLWALRAIDAICGTAHAAAVAGQYDSADGAVAYAASRGWRTAIDACRDFCGEPLPRAALMREGDLCARTLPGFPFGTVLVRLGGALIGPDAHGLVCVPQRVALVDPRWLAFPVGA